VDRAAGLGCGQRLFCPENRVGTADVYLITHHAQSFSRSYSDYYWGLSCCPPADVYALRPRRWMWSTALVGSGEKGHNALERFCANTSETDGKAEYIGLLAKSQLSRMVPSGCQQLQRLHEAIRGERVRPFHVLNLYPIRWTV
jgi:hypothetical protein